MGLEVGFAHLLAKDQIMKGGGDIAHKLCHTLDGLLQPALRDSASSSCCCSFSFNFCVFSDKRQIPPCWPCFRGVPKFCHEQNQIETVHSDLNFLTMVKKMGSAVFLFMRCHSYCVRSAKPLATCEVWMCWKRPAKLSCCWKNLATRPWNLATSVDNSIVKLIHVIASVGLTLLKTSHRLMCITSSTCMIRFCLWIFNCCSSPDPVLSFSTWVSTACLPVCSSPPFLDPWGDSVRDLGVFRYCFSLLLMRLPNIKHNLLLANVIFSVISPYFPGVLQSRGILQWISWLEQGDASCTWCLCLQLGRRALPRLHQEMMKMNLKLVSAQSRGNNTQTIRSMGLFCARCSCMVLPTGRSRYMNTIICIYYTCIDSINVFAPTRIYTYVCIYAADADNGDARHNLLYSTFEFDNKLNF